MYLRNKLDSTLVYMCVTIFSKSMNELILGVTQ